MKTMVAICKMYYETTIYATEVVINDNDDEEII